MRLVTFSRGAPERRAGALIERDSGVVDLQAAYKSRWHQPSRHLTSVLAIAEGGEEALELLREVAKVGAESALSRKSVILHAPIPEPPQI